MSPAVAVSETKVETACMLEPLVVMLDDLPGTTGRVADRFAVPGQGEPGRQPGDALQRGHEVAERIGP